MDNKKINLVLKEVVSKISVPDEDVSEIKKITDEFISKLKNKAKEMKIKVDIFVGGSFAKGTVMRKDFLDSDKKILGTNPNKKQGLYDVDIFMRFDKNYDDSEISKLTCNIIKDFYKFSVVHGSRDYFRVQLSSKFFIELIPVVKVNKPENSRNITDLSYSHVKYINNKINSNKILDEIKLAKAFCYVNNCYGAESYINGFSGYGIELLVYHYGSFLKFIKAVIKIENQEVIDIEKFYRNKKMVLMDINSSKLNSPIVLVDPTYKQRNVLAALSEETFNSFRKVCLNFLKNPSVKSFEVKKTDLKKIKEKAMKNKNDFILVEFKTLKQEGDVAGSKLLKFYRHILFEMEKFFEVKNKGFNYNGLKSSRCFFVVKVKKEIVYDGPSLKDKKNVKKFSKEHKKCFKKNGRIYAREKIDFGINDFLRKWKRKNVKKIKEMYIDDFKIIKF